MRNITKIRRDYVVLRRAGVAVLILLVLSYFFAHSILGATITERLVFGLVILGIIVGFGFCVIGREAIGRLRRARRDFLDMLEAHHDLMMLATEAQVMQNLATTPEGILEILIKNLPQPKREKVIRLTNARILLLELWLKEHPEEEVNKTDDGKLWLEFKRELASLYDLIKVLKKID